LYSSGRTPLHAAVRSGVPEVAKELLAAGADPYATDLFGRPPLYFAVRNRDTTCVQLLLSEYSIDDDMEGRWNTPGYHYYRPHYLSFFVLKHAAEFGLTEWVRPLLEKGLQVICDQGDYQRHESITGWSCEGATGYNASALGIAAGWDIWS